jgi:two-component system nitrate/nitrite response regulator NarL
MGEPLRVVIADDHELFRAEVRHDLTAAGLEVCGEADDGPGAVEAVARQAPDACLLDVGMPGDGIEAAAAIARRDNAPTVVMLSAVGDEETFGRALDAGVRGYLLKDFDGRRIAEALSRAVAGERVGPPAFLRLATLRDAASAGAR